MKTLNEVGHLSAARLCYFRCNFCSSVPKGRLISKSENLNQTYAGQAIRFSCHMESVHHWPQNLDAPSQVELANKELVCWDIPSSIFRSEAWFKTLSLYPTWKVRIIIDGVFPVQEQRQVLANIDSVKDLIFIVRGFEDRERLRTIQRDLWPFLSFAVAAEKLDEHVRVSFSDLISNFRHISGEGALYDLTELLAGRRKTLMSKFFHSAAGFENQFLPTTQAFLSDRWDHRLRRNIWKVKKPYYWAKLHFWKIKIPYYRLREHLPRPMVNWTITAFIWRTRMFISSLNVTAKYVLSFFYLRYQYYIQPCFEFDNSNAEIKNSKKILIVVKRLAWVLIHALTSKSNSAKDRAELGKSWQGEYRENRP